MANRKWNRMILDQIKDQLKTSNAVNELMEVLQLSSDSVYRRIRGDTPFTLHDLVRMGRHYRISIDKLTIDPQPWTIANTHPGWDVISSLELQKAWSRRQEAQIVLRDIPIELLHGLPTLKQYMRPYLPQIPKLNLLSAQTEELAREELIFSTQIMDQFICRLRIMIKQGVIERAYWQQRVLPEMLKLLNRVEQLLLNNKEISSVLLAYSPDPALANLMLIRGMHTDHTYLIQDSGLILRAQAGPLYRWVVLQIELRKWSSIPHFRLQTKTTKRLLRNWRKECRSM